MKTDIAEISDRALSNCESILSTWLPGGRVVGGEYVAANPTRQDKRAGSFKINVSTGVWSDFATGDSGGDLIDLYAYINSAQLSDAVKAVSLIVGSVTDPQKKKRKPETETWTPVDPVPESGAPAVPTRRTLPGAVAGEWVHYDLKFLWPYRTDSGQLRGYVVRYETPDGKETPSMTLWKNTAGNMKWRFKGFGVPRPLFNLDKIKKFPDAQILILEGEKKSDVLQALIDSAGAGDKIVCTNWIGGSQSVKKTDWSPLAGRRCILWPDADKPRLVKNAMVGAGVEAMRQVQEMLSPLGCYTRMMDVEKFGDKPDGWDVADAILLDGWDLKRILGFIRETSGPEIMPAENNPPVQHSFTEALPVEPLEESPPPTDADFTASWPFRPLGYNHGVYYYLPAGTRQVYQVSADKHNQGNLRALAPDQFWEREFPGDSGPVWSAASNSVMRACERVGVYDPHRQRGRGAWYDAGRAVLHLGDRLLVNNVPASITGHESRYIYEAGPVLELKSAKPLANVEAAKLRDITNSLFWERPIYGTYLAGWCMIAPICGCLAHRPHIWLTGGSGTGKTTVIESIVRPCLGEFAMFAQSATTSAGVRQELGCDAFPVVLDEFEGEDSAAQSRVQSMLELARQAFSETGAKILKGSAGGRAQHYVVRSAFFMSSIGVSLSQHADETRVLVLSLRKPYDTPEATKSEHFEKLNASIADTFTESWCAGLRARAIALIPQIRKNAEVFASVVAVKIGNRRAGDQIGPIIAGAYALVSEKYVTVEEAGAWVDRQDWSEQRTCSDESDEKKCLAEILHYRIREVSGVERSIVELISTYDTVCKDNKSIFEKSDTAMPDPENPSDGYLRRSGIRVDSENGIVWISDSHPGIKRILEKTPWSKGFSRLLKRIPGAETRMSMRFIGPPTRATGISLNECLGVAA